MEFDGEVLQTGRNTTGIEVPDQVVTELGGGKRPKVVATLNGYSYRSSIARMGDRFLLSVSAEVRAGAEVSAGDRLAVSVVLDTEERTVEVPDDLVIALSENPGARDRFDRLSYSRRRAHVTAVDGAKGADTRQRRIEKIVAELSEGL